MTDYFLDSTSGSNTSPFETWAKAATSVASLGGAVTLTSSDRVIISTTHTEGFTTTQNISFGGASVISSTVSGASTITATPGTAGTQLDWTSGSIDMTLDGGSNGSLMWGVNIESGRNINFDNLTLIECTIELGKNNTSATSIGVNGNGTYFKLYDCDVTQASTGATGPVFDVGNREFMSMHGGSVSCDRISDASNFCVLRAGDSVAEFDGVDLNGFTRDNLTNVTSNARSVVKFTNCGLNSNTTDTYNSVTVPGVRTLDRATQYIFDNARPVGTSVVVARYIQDIYGIAETDTSIYLDASDGTTSYSDKITTNSLCSEFFRYFRYELAKGFADFSTAKTMTVNFAQDGSATNLLDSEIWIEVQYPTSASTSYSKVTDRATDNQITADQTTNSESWTGLSGTNTKQQMAKTTSSGKEGPYTIFVCVAVDTAATGGTIYVDPKVNIT